MPEVAAAPAPAPAPAAAAAAAPALHLPPVAVYDLVLRSPARAVRIAVACGRRLEHAKVLAFTATLRDAAGELLPAEQVGWHWSAALGSSFAYAPALPGPGTAPLPVLTAEVPFTTVHLEAVVWDRRSAPSVPLGQLLFAWEPSGDVDRHPWTAVECAEPRERADA